MGSITLYQPQDLVAAYLKGWGYQRNDKLIGKLLAQISVQKKNLQIEDISLFLDEYVLTRLNEIMPEVCLPTEQKLAYFKMIFLMKKIYLECSLFDKMSKEQESYLVSCFNNNLYQIAPNILHADMFRQSIKTYHPVWKIKKTIAKGLRKIIHRKKGENKLV